MGQSPKLERVVEVYTALKPHIADLEAGLKALQNPLARDRFVAQVQSLFKDPEHKARFAKTKLRNAPPVDDRLIAFTARAGDRAEANLKIYEVVNAALLAVREDRLCPTYARRIPIRNLDSANSLGIEAERMAGE